MPDAGFDEADLQAFLEEASEHLRQLEAGLLVLEATGGAPDPGQLAEMFRAAHSIKGAAGMLGLAPLAALTHQLENLLGALREGLRALGPAEADVLFAAVDALSTLLLELAAGETRYDPAPVAAAIAALLAAPGPDAAGPQAPPPAWADQTGLWGQLPPAARRELAANAGREYVLEVTLALTGARVDDAGPQHELLDRLGTLARIHAIAWEPVATGAMLHGRALVASSAEPAMLEAFVPLDAAAMHVLAAPGEVPAAPVAAAPPPPPPKPERRAAAGSVRVDAERLDHLMDVVGELVIGHTRLARLGAELAARDERDPVVQALGDALASTDRLMGELQATVMATRMVPLERVFGKFQRLVRDLARGLGKDLKLETAGADTELDKTVVEELEDPLVHLIRNACDHGIGAPADRLAAGKPPTGTITLAARREGNHIVIAVSDDGRGIDPARVLAKAVQLGLAAPDAPLPDAEVLGFIFHPGFSTAERVTDVSGRGVGMDVVNQNIRAIKGDIAVRSRVGEGTTFEIRLPLTLAITKALLVRSGGDAFAIPLDAIQESIRVAPADVLALHGRPVIRLRDRVVPLLDLADAFGLAGRKAGHRPVVVVGPREKPVGLVVDALDGEQDVVIKPLGDYLGRVGGVAGATILGDGRVALILDVGALRAPAAA